MLKSKKFWIYAVIIYIAVTANSIMTQYLSENYTNAVKPGWEMWYHCEEVEGYYIMAEKVGVFSTGFTGSIELNDIYYNPKHPAISVALDVSVDKLNRKKYQIRLDDYDTEEEEFGGYARVDKYMNYLPESKYDKEHNDYMQNLLESNEQAISRLVEIANERWNLGLSYTDNKEETS